MKKLLLILFVICIGCKDEEVKPDYRNEVKGNYINSDPDFSVPLVIRDNVIFNNVWVAPDYEIREDSIFFVAAYKHVRWHFELKITNGELDGNHYRLNVDIPDGERFQPGTIKFIKS